MAEMRSRCPPAQMRYSRPERNALMNQGSGGRIVPPPGRNRLAPTTLRITISLMLLPGLIKADQAGQSPSKGLKSMSLEELGNIEVTTSSQQPVKIPRAPGALYALTEEAIRR